MANTQAMITTDMMSPSEQMELGLLTRYEWPTPLEQLSREEIMELGFATMASWQLISAGEMKKLTAERVQVAYEPTPTKSWADQMDDCDEIDWDVEDPLPLGRSIAKTWSEVAWGRCHCGCEEERSQGMRFGPPSNGGM